MQKIINGKRYDTNTATAILSLSSSQDPNDFDYEDTKLYRTAKGAFFLAGSGGARSRWGQQLAQGSRSGGSGLLLVDEAYARELVEQHGTPDDYRDVFGEPEEG